MSDPMEEAVEWELIDGDVLTAAEIIRVLAYVHHWRVGSIQRCIMDMVDDGRLILQRDLRVRLA